MEQLHLFNGSDYIPERDNARLLSQYRTIFNLMSDGIWRSLSRIAKVTGYPEASISAQLRHAKKEKWGSHTVNRRHVKNGLFEYQLIPKK